MNIEWRSRSLPFQSERNEQMTFHPYWPAGRLLASPAKGPLNARKKGKWRKKIERVPFEGRKGSVCLTAGEGGGGGGAAEEEAPLFNFLFLSVRRRRRGSLPKGGRRGRGRTRKRRRSKGPRSSPPFFLGRSKRRRRRRRPPSLSPEDEESNSLLLPSFPPSPDEKGEEDQRLYGSFFPDCPADRSLLHLQTFLLPLLALGNVDRPATHPTDQSGPFGPTRPGMGRFHEICQKFHLACHFFVCTDAMIAPRKECLSVRINKVLYSMIKDFFLLLQGFFICFRLHGRNNKNVTSISRPTSTKHRVSLFSYLLSSYC